MRAVFAILALPDGSGFQANALAASQWVTPLELEFGPVGLGAASPTLSVTITNCGDTLLTGWAGGGVNAPFSASQVCNITGGVLPGKSC